MFQESTLFFVKFMILKIIINIVDYSPKLVKFWLYIHSCDYQFVKFCSFKTQATYLTDMLFIKATVAEFHLHLVFHEYKFSVTPLNIAYYLRLINQNIVMSHIIWFLVLSKWGLLSKVMYRFFTKIIMS